MRKKLSVVLATFNEEENLRNCLNSVKSIAGEIIIVDGTSTDKTVEIAKEFGAKIDIIANQKNFHINKQKAIDKATKDWIFQLDADEIVDIKLAKEIKEVLEKESDFNGYWIPRKNWFLGRFLMKGGQYPDYTLRLYKKGKGNLPQKDVHEQTAVDGKVGYLTNPLEHMADKNLSRYFLRNNRYTDFISYQLEDLKIGFNPMYAIKYLILLPIWWFFLTYFRHKGFMDSWQGFLFSLFSSLRFPIGYVKYIKRLF